MTTINAYINNLSYPLLGFATPFPRIPPCSRPFGHQSCSLLFCADLRPWSSLFPV